MRVEASPACMLGLAAYHGNDIWGLFPKKTTSYLDDLPCRMIRYIDAVVVAVCDFCNMRTK
jgi:hypothetical protein